ncbi:DUF2796 domain-containing protein [Lamprocystis purpurea]|jgi:hypothetical protein|uniref:DUF2796 domain-containing protein n=1 Tax=Lamprocystis purpurea TaxID=61598 RepID=UPI00036BEF44|nr:DUF2796 domain-containing protein [Lamprocystis purpurea]
MNFRIALHALTAALTLNLPAALAQDAHVHREHGAHEHGVGSLTLALDGKEMEIELESPAANLVGFEHAPKDDAQRAALERAVALLKDGERLFSFPKAAGCRLTAASVSSSLLGHEPAEKADHEDHKAHAEAPSAAADHDAEHESHADLDADYDFECTHPEKIDQVEVGLFAAFPATERLKVQYVTARGQGGAELTKAQPRIVF